MKIGIYCETHEGAIGGSEQCAATLAAGLANTHAVELIHHRADMTGDTLGAFAGVDLRGAGMRFLPFAPSPPLSRNPFHVWRTQKAWNAELSAPYDVFVWFGHGMPPFCRARQKGVLVVLFPTDDRRAAAAARRGRGLRGHVEQGFSDRLWRQRLAGYRERAAISEYVRVWTERFWGIECAVLPPPVDTAFDVDMKDKEPFILSVGRFAGRGVRKRQPEMMTAFGEMGDFGWRYESVGGLSDLTAEQETFAAAVRAAEGHAACVRANVSRADLKDRFRRASIFWHAAGQGADLSQPKDVEHFGITTVEAMAAGCVPVVINRGGQPEIVEHGVSGFVWDTWDELKDYTRRLASDPELRGRMADAARLRAQEFSRERFVERFTRLLGEGT